VAEREESVGELFLGEAEEEVGLILGAVGGAFENPAIASGVELVDGVVAGGDAGCADGAGGLEKLVELEVVVAERAGDGRAASQVLVDKGLDDVALEAGLLVDNVVGDAEVLGDAAGVIHIIERAAATGLRSLCRVGDSALAGQTGLVPQLKGEADDGITGLGEHSRDRRGVDSSGHGYGDGFGLGHGYQQVSELAGWLYPSVPATAGERARRCSTASGTTFNT